MSQNTSFCQSAFYPCCICVPFLSRVLSVFHPCSIPCSIRVPSVFRPFSNPRSIRVLSGRRHATDTRMERRLATVLTKEGPMIINLKATSNRECTPILPRQSHLHPKRLQPPRSCLHGTSSISQNYTRRCLAIPNRRRTRS